MVKVVIKARSTNIPFIHSTEYSGRIQCTNKARNRRNNVNNVTYS